MDLFFLQNGNEKLIQILDNNKMETHKIFTQLGIRDEELAHFLRFSGVGKLIYILGY